MRISEWSSDVCSSDLVPAQKLSHRGAIDCTRELKALTEDTPHRPKLAGLDLGFDPLGHDVDVELARDLDQSLDKHHRWRSEEHTSELQSLMRISYAVFCLKQKKRTQADKTQTINTNKTPQ